VAKKPVEIYGQATLNDLRQRNLAAKKPKAVHPPQRVRKDPNWGVQSISDDPLDDESAGRPRVSQADRTRERKIAKKSSQYMRADRKYKSLEKDKRYKELATREKKGKLTKGQARELNTKRGKLNKAQGQRNKSRKELAKAQGSGCLC
jgi:hypothetical protein